MDKIPFPTPEDIIRFNDQIPAWSVSPDDFEEEGDQETSVLNEFLDSIEIESWAKILGHRLKEADYSFILASFYFEKGIPDDEWHKSTDTGIKYFPNFDDSHNRLKFGFEYYGDVYFYKAFSVLDTMAHILTLMYGLKWGAKERMYFSTAYPKLEPIKPELFAKLKSIIDTDEYRKVNRLRNDSTHNYSPGHVNSGVVRKENVISLTVGEYMPVREKYQMMQWMCYNLIEILKAIKIR